MQIGGKTKKKLQAPSKPQVVIQLAFGLNQFALLGADDKGNVTLSWIGDPYAATKYESKYDAKNRTRHIAEIPESRVFKVLEEQRKQSAA
jgi:hypothetical protein